MRLIVFSLLAVVVAVILMLSATAVLLWRSVGPDDRVLLRRIHRLPVRRKLRLAGALMRDRRIPLRLRAIPPGLVLYLASPLDLVPDFIPVVGLLDDVLVGIVGIGLLVRFTPRGVLDEQIARLER